jgi:monoamine oxidase
MEAARAAGLAVEDLPDRHAWVRDGRCRSFPRFWERFDALRRRIPEKGPDRSFADFLARQRIPRREAEMARMFVEGYHAAPVDRMSAQSLAGGDEEAEERSQHRLVAGYDRLMAWLRAGLDPSRVTVRLMAMATRVRWQRRRAEVTARVGTGAAQESFRGRAVVVALPLGVLKAPPEEPGGVRFEPEPRHVRAALAGLDMGAVVKVCLRFRERVWRDEADFLHDPKAAFPTWWTCAPLRAPVLTAWAGGPAALALRGLDARGLVDVALATLAPLLGRPRGRLERGLEGSASHDWQADPFSRGAYAHVLVGGMPAQRALGRAVEDTLFFAGEATDAEQTGTVSGAIASGRRAARQVMAALAR